MPYPVQMLDLPSTPFLSVRVASLVLLGRQALQILDLIATGVLVLVMDFPSIWNGPVMMDPDVPMQEMRFPADRAAEIEAIRLAITLRIAPVSPSQEFRGLDHLSPPNTSSVYRRQSARTNPLWV
jgi:hypothetical protein